MDVSVHSRFASDPALYYSLPFTSPCISAIISDVGRVQVIHYLKIYPPFSFPYKLFYIYSLCVIFSFPCPYNCLCYVVCFCVIYYLTLEAAGDRLVCTLHHLHPHHTTCSVLQYQYHSHTPSPPFPSLHYSFPYWYTNQ